MSAKVKHGILPASVYNTLPNIRGLLHVPDTHGDDIAVLKELLDKHDLSDKVRIKLVHIHFRLSQGEVFAARQIEVPKHGAITIMQPLVAAKHKSLFGYHYYVDNDGNLSAYEYMEAPGPDLSEHEAFVQEFCHVVQHRGLQRKFGLCLRHEDDHVSTHELEYRLKRVCIDVPYKIELPYNADSFETMTEFLRDATNSHEVTKSHSHHSHCRHTDRRRENLKDYSSDNDTVSIDELSDSESANGLTVSYGLPREIDLAGTKLTESSDLFGLVSYVADST